MRPEARIFAEVDRILERCPLGVRDLMGGELMRLVLEGRIWTEGPRPEGHVGEGVFSRADLRLAFERARLPEAPTPPNLRSVRVRLLARQAGGLSARLDREAEEARRVEGVSYLAAAQTYAQRAQAAALQAADRYRDLELDRLRAAREAGTGEIDTQHGRKG